MTKIKGLLFILIICTATVATAQKPAANDWGINFSGFVKTDAFFDTRETVSIREGHFYLYPAYESLDINGDDINANPGFNILSIQTRLTGKITAPDVAGAKASGVIEGAFFGSEEININSFRLRHAFVKLDWENTQLLIGQYWHPMFITSCFPGVVSFNTGVPFQPFSRNPQIRLTQKAGPASIILAANTQRDFRSAGPTGGAIEQSNAVIPEMNAQLHLNFGKHLIGFGGEYKMLMPRTSTFNSATGITEKTDEKVASFAGMAFAKFVFGNFSAKLEGVYGQNLHNMVMLGGFAEQTVDTLDNGALAYTYTPMQVMSAWIDLEYAINDNWKLGLFGGYTKNMGTQDDIYYEEIPGEDLPFIKTSQYWGRGYSATGYEVESVMRVSPRLIWQSGKVRLTGEIDFTQAQYGNADLQDKLTIVTDDIDPVSNIRALFAAYIFF